ncbi:MULTISPECIES: DNA-processing protein DprA [Nocardiopsis]|uniref:DNA processing protein DprA n=1 Tax=Nocardiopsis sinuspersici TaxID=501010 RepID=A0A1V3C520_9ACTN|nr:MULTISPECIES: DNA-processing protein DprA [Nocardiopsis]OOC55881.1 DNA processing protein DprA [Nocardiopsis sinuspersici]
MKQSEERVSLLALLLSGRVSWRRAVTDVLETTSAHQALMNALGQGETLFELEKDPVRSALTKARELVGWCVSHDVGIHAFWEDGYPLQLRDVHEMPPVVFTRGTVVPDERRAIAVVGSRKASDRGLEVTGSIARELAREGITVVSGLASGIDTMAHRTALSYGGRTVAVIGTGIDRYYPPENRALQDEIAVRGLLLSQFLPDAPPTRQSFPMRNAVMSGYAAATVVVEAGEHSGARIQARMALQHGRPVILPRELLTNTWAREYARRPGVHVVGGISELMDTVHSVLANAEVAPEDLVEDTELVW